jgi:short-subunit dehydrogenase
MSSGSPVGTVVITGASSGIGRCTALLFGRNGWNVGLIARGPAGLASIRGELVDAGVRAACAAADVSDAAALDAAAALLESELGPITVWVNCAGNGVYGRFLDVTVEEFRQVTDVTYMGTVNGTRVALQRMVPRDAGTVINVCSAIAFGGLPVLSSYSGAKHAVRGFSDSVRHELIHQRSRVSLTTIFPPAVNTPFFSHAASHLSGSPRPAKPVYQPEIVADAILLAAMRRRSEMRVTGTTVLFNLATRLIPGIVHMAIQRLGSAGQQTDDEAVVQLREPSLFAPPPQASGGHGPFDAESRRFSVQMWLNRCCLAVSDVVVAIGRAVLGRLGVNVRPDAPSHPIHAPQDPHPMPAGSAQPPAGP